MRFPGAFLLWISTGLSLLFALALLSGVFRLSEFRYRDFPPPDASAQSGSPTPAEQEQRLSDFRGGMVVHANPWKFLLLTPLLLWGLVRLFDRPMLSTRTGYLATTTLLIFFALLAVFLGAFYELYQ